MNKLTPPVGPGDHVLGDAGATVTLVEFGDYECPFCGRAHLVLGEVLPQVSPEVRFVFRHFPLVQIHPHALAAAEAAEAAGAQGKFWAMHELLFENQGALEPENLVGYAEALGLDIPRFVREASNHARIEGIEVDLRSGAKSGVMGTPTFYINGIRHDAGWDIPTLLSALRAAILAKAA
jgi:protein-disulfide isomerase